METLLKVCPPWLSRLATLPKNLSAHVFDEDRVRATFQDHRFSSPERNSLYATGHIVRGIGMFKFKRPSLWLDEYSHDDLAISGNIVHRKESTQVAADSQMRDIPDLIKSSELRYAFSAVHSCARKPAGNSRIAPTLWISYF